MNVFNKFSIREQNRLLFCQERKNEIAIKSSKRFYRCHVYEIELKENKALNDFTYLLAKAKYIFYYLYSLEKTKGKLDVLFNPVVTVVWEGKLTFEDEADYNGPIFSGFLLPTFSFDSFFSNFNSSFFKLINHDNIVTHNCENIKVFLSFLEQSFVCKEGKAIANTYEYLTRIDGLIEEKYINCEEKKPEQDEWERQTRRGRELEVRMYKEWKEKNNIDEEDNQENLHNNIIDFLRNLVFFKLL